MEVLTMSEQAPKGTLNERVKELFVARLAQGGWTAVEELAQLLPDELAQEQARTRPPFVYEGTGPLGYGREALTAAAVKALVADEVCEARRLDGKERIRLIDPSAIATKTETGQRDERSERPAEPATTCTATLQGALTVAEESPITIGVEAPCNRPSSEGEVVTCEVRELPLDQLRLDGETQPRAELNCATIDDYAEELANGAEFPPAEAMFDGSHYWLWSGFHRYHGHKKAGRKTIMVRVTTGTLDDARWLALGTNKDHGLRRSNADKRRAAERALAMRPEMSNRAIAEWVGVSYELVNDVRKALTESVSQPSTRQGRDGRNINTGNIGQSRILARKEPGDAEAHDSESPRDGDEDETPPEEETTAPRDEGVGLERAHEAIAALQRIPLRDPLRKDAFRTVADWIVSNQ
jgi:hypothetical protein